MIDFSKEEDAQSMDLSLAVYFGHVLQFTLDVNFSHKNDVF